MLKFSDSRRNFLKDLSRGAGLAAFGALAGCIGEHVREVSRPSEDSPINLGVQYRVIFPGTWSLDVDSLRLGIEYNDKISDTGLLDVDTRHNIHLKRIKHYFDKSGRMKPYEPSELLFGANSDNVDLLWKPTPYGRLVPLNGAKLAKLGKGELRGLTLEGLMSKSYSADEIIGGDYGPELEPGTVVAVKTFNPLDGRNSFAAMRVEGYFPVTYQKNFPGSSSQQIIEERRYDLICTFVLYGNK